VPALTCVDGGTINSQRGQAYTQFVPVGDVDGAMTILPPGNSERPDSPWHDSAVAAWETGELRPAPLSRGAVETIAAGTFRLPHPVLP
jgi:penicillin G amidase